MGGRFQESSLFMMICGEDSTLVSWSTWIEVAGKQKEALQVQVLIVLGTLCV